MITTMVKKNSKSLTFAPITFIETHKRNKKLNPRATDCYPTPQLTELHGKLSNQVHIQPINKK